VRQFETDGRWVYVLVSLAQVLSHRGNVATGDPAPVLHTGQWCSEATPDSPCAPPVDEATDGLFEFRVSDPGPHDEQSVSVRVPAVRAVGHLSRASEPNEAQRGRRGPPWATLRRRLPAVAHSVPERPQRLSHAMTKRERDQNHREALRDSSSDHRTDFQRPSSSDLARAHRADPDRPTGDQSSEARNTIRETHPDPARSPTTATAFPHPRERRASPESRPQPVPPFTGFSPVTCGGGIIRVFT
jgi:hypothetical protein